jgi:fumarate hydratase subunit beta
MPKKIKLPVSEATIRALKAGDEVEISGIMITARDAAHKYMIEQKPDYLHKILNGSMIYHCGPVVAKAGEKGGQPVRYRFVAAGPTTSIREEPYEAAVIDKYGVRGVIGKGGMGATTLAACEEFGCVYLSAVGGLATTLARSIVEVLDVYKLEEFGVPEAMWVIRVEDFPAVVTMDAHRKSVHDEIAKLSRKNYERLVAGE